MNLRTITHLLRTDLYRLRWLVILTLFLLLVDFMLVLLEGTWFGDRFPGGGAHNYPQRVSRFDPILVVGVAAAFLAGAAGWNGWAWSRTRPVRAREAVSAKVLFLLLFLILPQMLMVFTAHVCCHLTPAQAVRTTLAAASVFVPMWVTMLALGRLAGSSLAFSGGLALIALLGGIGMLFDKKMETLFLTFLGPWGRYPGPHSWYLLGASAGALLLLVKLAGNRWSVPVRLTVAAAIITGLGWHWRTLDFFSITSGMEDLNEVSRPQQEAVQPLPSYAAYIATETSTSGQHAINIYGSFRSAALPPGVFAFWQPCGAARLRHNGNVVAEAPSRQGTGGRPHLSWFYPPANSAVAAEALAAVLPPGARLDEGPMLGFSIAPSLLGQFKPVKGAQFDAIPAELEIDLAASLFRYETLVDTPFEKEAHATFGDVHLQVRPWPARKGVLEVSAQCPATGVSADPLTVSWRLSPLSVWRVFLLQPSTGLLIRGELGPGEYEPILGGAGLHRQQYYFQNVHGFNTELDTIEPGARVIILAPKLLGLVIRKFTTPPLFLYFPGVDRTPYFSEKDSAKPAPPLPIFPYGDPRRPDPAKATRAEFGQWLALNRNHRQSVLTTREFRRWMPNHLDTILRLGHSDFHEHEAAMDAVTAGLADSEKARVIAKLPESPGLVSVIHQRGWEKEAREELLTLFRSGTPMGLSGLLSVARLEEPETYDRLLGLLEADCNGGLYDALGHLPGIEPRLTETVRRIFDRSQRQYVKDDLTGKYRNLLRIPLRHGMPEALAEFLTDFRKYYARLKPEQIAHSFVPSYLKALITPPGRDQANKETCEFLGSIKAEDCRFDPLTRRWITPGALP